MWSLAMNQFLYWVVVSVFCSKAKNSQGKPDLFGKETDHSFSYKFIPLDLMPIQAKQAALMKSCLPPSLLQMIDANTWPGEALMVYCDTGRPFSYGDRPKLLLPQTSDHEPPTEGSHFGSKNVERLCGFYFETGLKKLN